MPNGSQNYKLSQFETRFMKQSDMKHVLRTSIRIFQPTSPLSIILRDTGSEKKPKPVDKAGPARGRAGRNELKWR